MIDSEILTEIKVMLWELHRDPPSEILLQTDLSSDLRIDGDDAVDIFQAIHDRWNVDFSSMQWDRHFGPEGSGIISLSLYSWGQRHWSRLPVSVSDLVDAIHTGKWQIQYEKLDE